MYDFTAIPGPDFLSDSSLYERARGGDVAAFEGIYRQLAPWLYTKLRTRQVASQVAEDLVQNTLHKLFENIDHVDRKREGGSSKGWCFTVAMRLFLSEIRKEKRVEREIGIQLDAEILLLLATRNFESSGDSSTGADRAWMEATALSAIRSVQKSTKPENWQTFIEMYCNGMTEKQAAREFGISPHAATMRKLRILKKLRDAGLRLSDEKSPSDEQDDGESV